jgi:hypothetical protein
MNNILPSGLTRFNTAGVTNNINFDNQSTIIGEFAGEDLKLDTDGLYRNIDNTMLGYKAGQYSINLAQSTFIGSEAGIYIGTGSNNLIIGRDHNYGFPIISYDVISVGYYNKSFANAVTIGFDNENIGPKNTLIGRENVVSGNNNVIIGNSQSSKSGNNNVIMGNMNTADDMMHSVIIGNNNIKKGSSESILIGNNVYNNDTILMNIGDIIYQYSNSFVTNADKVSDMIIGYNHNEILNGDHLIHTCNITHNGNIFVKNNIYVPKISIDTVTLACLPELSDSNIFIEYILPKLPDDNAGNVALSLQNKNEMVWKRLYINTDEIPQGTSNLYYDANMIDAYIEANFRNKLITLFNETVQQYLPTMSLDNIYNGTSNTMIIDKTYDDNLNVTGTLSVNKLVVHKIEVLSYGGNEFSHPAASSPGASMESLMNTIDLLTKRIEYLEGLNGVIG